MKLIQILALLCGVFLINDESDAALIEVGYSGTIDTSFAHFEPGSVVSVWFAFESDSPFDLIDGKVLFPVFDIVLNLNGESVTNEFGYLRVFEDRLEFRAGAGIADGGGSPFSDLLAGVDVRGISMTLWGSFIADVLPADAAQLYGGSGEFSVYRTYGSLYDVNHPVLLQLPPHRVITIPAPSTLFLMCLALLFTNPLVRAKFNPSVACDTRPAFYHTAL